MSPPHATSRSDESTRLEIIDLLARYCQHLDRREYDRCSELFTTDATMMVGRLRFEGRDAIFAMMDASPYGMHLAGLPAIELTGEGRATVLQNLIFVPVDGSPNHSVLYDDHLVRTSDGWRFQSRQVRFIKARKQQ